MEKRRLGRAGHMSSVVAFGGAALSKVEQSVADEAVRLALDHGVNHFDVAPTYGEAELRLRPWMKEYRSQVFLACKTTKRTRDEAWAELRRSMERLGVDSFDLYQLHGLDKLEELDVALGPGGAMEAFLEAREQGLVRYIGITGHRPATQVEALKRFDLDTVLFPLNYVLRAHRVEENDYEPLLRLARARDVGLMAIKAIAKRPWQTETHAYETWYEPFDSQRDIDLALWFALSQGITTAVMAGDVRLIPKILDAAERRRELSETEQAELVKSAASLKPIFPR